MSYAGIHEYYSVLMTVSRREKTLISRAIWVYFAVRNIMYYIKVGKLQVITNQ